MKKILLLTFVLSTSLLIESKAQSKNSFLLSLGFDVFKTDNTGFAEKSQVGLEGNYFFANKVSGTLGFEFWSARTTLVALGVRLYPVDPVFIKLRALLANNSDFSIGMGYSKGIGGNFRFEGGMDYYFDPGDLGLRIGLSYLF